MGKLVAYQAVEYATGLLGVDAVLGDVARVGDGVMDSALSDFTEGNAFGFTIRGFENFFKVPGNGFAFAIFVSGEVYFISLLGRFLEGSDVFFGFGGDNVFRFEVVVCINAENAFGKVADMTVAAFDGEPFAQIFLDSPGLGR